MPSWVSHLLLFYRRTIACCFFPPVIPVMKCLFMESKSTCILTTIYIHKENTWLKDSHQVKESFGRKRKRLSIKCFLLCLSCLFHLHSGLYTFQCSITCYAILSLTFEHHPWLFCYTWVKYCFPSTFSSTPFYSFVTIDWTGLLLPWDTRNCLECL
jgi:hypothetical protein